jgi:type VI secretion system secreted protein VgrG
MKEQSLRVEFECGEGSFTAAHFHTVEKMSSFYWLGLTACSPFANLDPRDYVGKKATFHMDTGLPGGQRRHYGIVRSMRHLKAALVSTYYFEIVPPLWLLTLHRDSRIFQHQTVPDVIRTLLTEWHLDADWRIDEATYPKREYRVQYGETTYAFFCRLLEEAGICFYLIEDDRTRATRIVLTDAAHAAELRSLGPIHYLSDPSDMPRETYVSRVHLEHALRPDRVVVWQHDFRGRAEVPTAAAAGEPHSRREHYYYEPGFFVDDKGAARLTEQHAFAVTQRRLESCRVGDRSVKYRTNAVDLHPGRVFALSDHPSSDLDTSNRLLAVSLVMKGTANDVWTCRGKAVFAAAPYRSRQITPKPRINGVQSATVVGPGAEEIHTEALGRVRVQFPWDRHGRFTDHSSCWMRVSQSWAGAGAGMMAVPRVGEEVLVAYYEGDPDHPVIVGRVHGGATPPPLALPENKAWSAWRGCSTPGGGGANEIHLDDASGAELLYLHAERDLHKIVKASEEESTGGNRTSIVGSNRKSTVGAMDSTLVGQRYSVTMTPLSGGGQSPTGIEMREGQIRFTTGKASLVLDGEDIYLEASGSIRIHSTDDDVLIQGAPNIKLNCGLASSKRDLELALVDPFGNPIQRSWLRAEVHVDGKEPEVHEGFTRTVARGAAGKNAVVHFSAPEIEGEAEGDEQE